MAAVYILFVSTGVQLATASIVNVAQGKRASMSSSKSGYRAGTAVDGNTDAEGFGPDQIINTDTGQAFAWWKVDLQREIQDATVRIYFRTDYKRRRNGVKLYTSTSQFSTSNPTSQGQLCRNVTGRRDGSDIPDVYNVTCPGRWRYLLLYTDTDNDGRGPILDFGEVEVFVCSDGTYGEDCNNFCSSRKCVTMTTRCERDGICPDGCQSGWTGVDCRQECDFGFYGPGCSLPCSNRNCVEPSTECNHVTGQCRGCKPGYKGIACVEECPAGTFGSGCTSCTTRHCQGESDCPADGTCSQGCQDGWTGNTCLEECSRGVFGPGCSITCGNCSSNYACHHVSGKCPSGCKAGWRTEMCNEVCSEDTYGPGCTEKCGKCDGVCDSVDGRCPAGCLDGYCGIKCDLALIGDVNGKELACFDVASLVGAVVGTFLTVVLLAVGIHIYLIRQGRLQWIKTSDAKKSVQVSRDFTQMSSIAARPADVSENAQPGNQVYNNDYAVLDTGQMQGNKDYDVIQPKHY